MLVALVRLGWLGRRRERVTAPFGPAAAALAPGDSLGTLPAVGTTFPSKTAAIAEGALLILIASEMSPAAHVITALRRT